METYKFIKSKRGGSLLLHNNHLYKIHSKRKSTTYWTCDTENCSSRATIKDCVLTVKGLHYHEPDIKKITKMSIYEKLKARSASDVHESIPEIFRQEIEKVGIKEEEINIKAATAAMHRARAKIAPHLPIVRKSKYDVSHLIDDPDNPDTSSSFPELKTETIDTKKFNLVDNLATAPGPSAIIASSQFPVVKEQNASEIIKRNFHFVEEDTARKDRKFILVTPEMFEKKKVSLVDGKDSAVMVNKRKFESVDDEDSGDAIDIGKFHSVMKEDTALRILANISGPYSSGSKLKNVDLAGPSTSTQEEVLPDIKPTAPPIPDSMYDPNIVIKQEVIETEVDPSTIYDPSTARSPEDHRVESTSTTTSETILPKSNIPTASGNPLQGAITVKVPLVHKLIPLTDPVENIVPNASENRRPITEPITHLKVMEDSSIMPRRLSKKLTKARKAGKRGKRSPTPSESSSDEDYGGLRRPRDKFDAYAEFVASKLRDLDPRSCAFVQIAIADLIFEAELGRFLSEGDKSIFANKTHEILRNMPLPCEEGANV